MEIKAVKLEIFIPEEHIESFRVALHDIGVGHIGQYDHCLSITQVSGFWRPLPGSNPHEGKVGEVSYGTECKAEVDCPIEHVAEALRAIKAIHPYDEPLINVIPLLNHFFADATAVSPGL